MCQPNLSVKERKASPLRVTILLSVSFVILSVFAGDIATSIPVSPLPRGLSSLMPVPTRNPITEEKLVLGERLFFDRRLSADGTVSCGTCHRPELAFTDGNRVPTGVDNSVGRRNVPTLLNCAFGTSMFWDGRAGSLEEQALLPLTNPNEMASSMDQVMMLVRADSKYRLMFEDAFGLAEAPIEPDHVADALATYQRSLVAGDSDFDRYDFDSDTPGVSDAARRGFLLFRGRARCSHCHEGFRFTDDKFHNTGVSWGRKPPDLGRFEYSGKERDKGKFKTPTLRNVAQTGPYMHDGSLESLRDVIEFYDRGGNPNPYLNPILRPLELDERESADLIEFLKSLSSSMRDFL